MSKALSALLHRPRVGTLLSAFRWSRNTLKAVVESPHAAVAPVLVFAALVRVIWVIEVDAAHEYTDAQFFVALAANLDAGEGFTIDGVAPTAFWPVGYPATLAVILRVAGDVRLAGELLNVAAGVVVAALTYSIGYRLHGRRVAVLSAAIVALLPAQVFATSLLLSDGLYTAVQMAALALVLLALELQGPAPAHAGPGYSDRPEFKEPVDLPPTSGPSAASSRRLPNILSSVVCLTAGLAIGYAILISPVAWLILVLAVMVLVARLRSSSGNQFTLRWALASIEVRHILLMCLGVAILCTPWLVRNWQDIGAGANLSTNGGINLLAGNHEGADGCSSWNAEKYDYVWALPEVERDREATANAISYVLRNPGEELALLPRKFDCMWLDDSSAVAANGAGLSDSLSSEAQDRWEFVARWYYYAILGLVLVGIPLWWRRSAPHLLVVLLVASTAIYYLAFQGQERYRYPLMPVLAIWAACGAFTLVSGLRVILQGEKIDAAPPSSPGL